MSVRGRRAGRDAAREAVDVSVPEHRPRPAERERPVRPSPPRSRRCWPRSRTTAPWRSAGSTPRISSDHIQGYFNVASAVANAATGSSSRLTAAGRSVRRHIAAGRPAAWTRSSPSFGKRAFRRPLDPRPSSPLMKDVAQGTSPAPRQRHRGDPKRRRDAADVAALREPPGADGHADLRARRLPGPRCLRGRIAAVVHVLADAARRRPAGGGRRRIARDRPGFARAARSRVRRSAHRATRSGSSGTSGCASNCSPASPTSAPRSWRWRRAKTWASPGHDHWGEMVREVRDLTNLYTWTHAGDLRPAPDLGPVGHAFGRSGPPLRRAGLERQRRLPALHRRQPQWASCSARRCSSSSLEQTNPFHRGSFIRRSIPCDNLPQPEPEQLAARIALFRRRRARR